LPEKGSLIPIASDKRKKRRGRTKAKSLSVGKGQEDNLSIERKGNLEENQAFR